jgi:hypothetical protein
VGILDQVLQLPFAYLWLPGLAFVAVVGGFFFLTRPAKIQPDVIVETSVGQPQPPVPAKAKDQRGMARRHGNPVEVHVAPPEAKESPEVGSVLDRSMGGMRLALFHEVEAGSVISIRPVHADAMIPWVDLEVRSCKASQELPGQFEVGCQYVKSPPYSIQLLFG